MALIDHIDPVSRRIYLSIDSMDIAWHPVELYREVRYLRKTSEALRGFDNFMRGAGNISKGGGKSTERYFTLLLGTRIIPWDASHIIDVTGTLITDDGLEGAFCFEKSGLSAGVSVDIQYAPKQVEVINLNFDDLVYSSFQNAVWYKADSPYTDAGLDTLPNGNAQRPVNNIPLAVDIAVTRGFRQLNVMGDLDLVGGDDATGLHLVGTTHLNSILTIDSAAVCLDTGFSHFDITGDLDGGSEIRDCIVRDLEYFNGHIHDSYLAATIKLRGSLPANISNCEMLDMRSPPTIDFGGTGQDLMMPDYAGLIEFTNLTGPSLVGISLRGGTVTLDSTCIAGTINISGNGRVINNSGNGCYVINTTTDGSEVHNLKSTIELMRPHHTGLGKTIFWDAYDGDDTHAGDHENRATKTFAQAHVLAEDNGHDVIVCLSGNPSGVTIATENCVITKNYLFVRSMGRNFKVHSANDSLPAFDIQANGVEISSMQVTTNTTNTVAAIRSVGKFPLLKDLYIGESANGILVNGGEFGIIDNCRVSHGSGYGVRVEGASEHFNIKESHIGSNADDGVQLAMTTGHEVYFSRTVIHSNGGYGIDIDSGSDTTIIDNDVTLFNNTLGNVRDDGGATHNSSNSGATIKQLALDTTAIKAKVDNIELDVIDIHDASYNKREHDSVANTITIYEDDGVTVKKVFTTNPDLSTITPQ